jgi:hypothetical protein
MDWTTGKLKWQLKNPIEYSLFVSRYGMAIIKNYLILSGLAIRESISHGPVIPNDFRGPIRMLATIDMKSGKLIAKWYEPTFSGKWMAGSYFPPMPNGGGKLSWYKGELYHVTDADFSKISLDDIASFSNGWVSPNDSGKAYNEISR